MAENKNTVKAFDSSEPKRIIEELEAEGFRHLRGEVQISRHRSYTAICLISEQLFEGQEWPDEMPRGAFLLLPTYDLVEVLKKAFDLR